MLRFIEVALGRALIVKKIGESFEGAGQSEVPLIAVVWRVP